MVKKLEWDSNFFGYPVGLFVVNPLHEFPYTEFIEESQKFKLVYIFSSLELNNFRTLKLVDKKVILTKKISQDNNFDVPLEFDNKLHSYEQLSNLAYLSGIYSRFKIDSNFLEDDFFKIYKEWLDKSLDKKLAFGVFIKHIENKVAGFISVGKKDKETAKIGLIAVDKAFQGRNLATKLIQNAEHISILNKYKSIEVATQLENIPAVNLYKKNGFNIESITNIYHYWNL